jgi:hypothetical protein
MKPEPEHRRLEPGKLYRANRFLGLRSKLEFDSRLHIYRLMGELAQRHENGIVFLLDIIKLNARNYQSGEQYFLRLLGPTGKVWYCQHAYPGTRATGGFDDCWDEVK